MFRLDARNTFFTAGMVRHWHMLRRETMDALSVKPFKARLNGVLGTLIWRAATISYDRGLDGLQGSSEPQALHDSMINLKNEYYVSNN